MKLTRFRATNFRSIEDSGWIDADDVTALIGVNESGKTNLLLPLWKLNPARDGEIQPTSDFPKTKFGEIRDNRSEYSFIEAEFDTGPTAAAIAETTGIPIQAAQVVRVTRFYDGGYRIEFPKYEREETIGKEELIEELNRCAATVESGETLKKENDLQKTMSSGLREIADRLGEEAIGIKKLGAIQEAVNELVPAEPAKTSVIVPVVQQLRDRITSKIERISAPSPEERKDVFNIVMEALPSFVYYSNYGNLDSEIYLPHVVQNLEREDLGTKEAAKARTLRVLFRFVRLEAQEILDLGLESADMTDQGTRPTEEQIDEDAEKKRERSILLQSASAQLTTKFRDWWKQGDYRFRFEADGNHFRIWVADDRRPTEVELENRSSGLQWFLSFYLVFLVESQGEHRKAILLLDEPGMGLHPYAQRDLSAFFENLSKTNQIIYTSHSPFLVDADRLDRARKVYVANDGTTKATPDLRRSEGKDEQTGAAYAVYSALNLRVAESLLLGCQPVVVEGASDQHYLSAIKALLISEGRITPARELVFPPSGGTRTTRIVASILTGRDEKLPVVLLDADKPGKQTATNLKRELYDQAPERVLSVADFVEFDAAEIEDLFPPEFLADELDRMERHAETRLADRIQPGIPFVPQVKQWAEVESVILDKHWKVQLAIKAKQRALTVGIQKFDDATVERWVKLFNAFHV